MKVTGYGIAIAAIAQIVAGKLTPAKKSPALHAKDISLRPRNDLEARSYDYCGLTSYYCLDSICCGISWFHCMPSGAECCASYLASGEGLWCESGSSCTVVGGYVKCKDSNGDTFSAGSTAIGAPASTGGGGASQTGGGGSSSTYTSRPSTYGSKKKKSKAWIAAAVIVPLIGVAVIAGVVFFLCVLQKKKNANAAASAAVVASQQGGAPGSQPAMTTAPAPPMSPAPQQHMGAVPVAPNPDLKTPAYTYQYEVPTPASPAPVTASPAPIPPPQTTNELYGMSSANPNSLMSTGNAVYTPQPVYGNAMELPTGLAAPAPRGGAHEMS